MKIIILICFFSLFTFDIFSKDIVSFKEETELYSISINKSDVPDSLPFNGKMIKVDHVSEIAITPKKIEFKNSKLKEIFAEVLQVPQKYIHLKGSENIYDLTMQLKLNNMHSDSARKVVLFYLIKAFDLKYSIVRETITVNEIYVEDSVKNKKAIEMPGRFKRSLTSIARQVDGWYNNGIFIWAFDNQPYYNFNYQEKMSFESLKQLLNNNFGLGLRKVQKEYSFVVVEPFIH